MAKILYKVKKNQNSHSGGNSQSGGSDTGGGNNQGGGGSTIPGEGD